MQSHVDQSAGISGAEGLRHTADSPINAEGLPLQVMKFAIATRVKAMAFLSSVAVVGGLDHPQDVMESEVGTQLCTEHPGDGGYAVGCAPASAHLRMVHSVWTHCECAAQHPALIGAEVQLAHELGAGAFYTFGLSSWLCEHRDSRRCHTSEHACELEASGVHRA